MKTVTYIETFERQIEVEVTDEEHELLVNAEDAESVAPARTAVIAKVQYEATEIAECQRIHPELTGACCVDEDDVELFDL